MSLRGLQFGNLAGTGLDSSSVGEWLNSMKSRVSCSFSIPKSNVPTSKFSNCSIMFIQPTPSFDLRKLRPFPNLDLSGLTVAIKREQTRLVCVLNFTFHSRFRNFTLHSSLHQRIKSAFKSKILTLMLERWRSPSSVSSSSSFSPQFPFHREIHF